MQDLVQVILKLQSADRVEDFLHGILTQQEIEQLEQRLEIVRRLKAGQPQRQIAKDLGVGVATVTRGSQVFEVGEAKIFVVSIK